MIAPYFPPQHLSNIVSLCAIAATNVAAASYCANFNTCSLSATLSTKSCLGIARRLLVIPARNGGKQPPVLDTVRGQPGPVRVRARAQGGVRKVCSNTIYL